ncbi:hypothetical protein H4R34_005337, partial [Dimargaris verticillata]
MSPPPPRSRTNLYVLGQNALDRLQRRQGSLKKVTIGDQRIPSVLRRPLYALVCETLKHYAVLVEVIARSALVTLEAGLKGSWTLALVLTHDALLTDKGVRALPPGWMRNALKRQLPALKQHLAELLAEHQVDDVKALRREAHPAMQTMPRYARVNLLKTTLGQVVAYFQAQDYALRDRTAPLATLQGRSFQQDPHLDDLVAFSPGTDLHAHPLFLNGGLILQDKASCFPATVLHPPPGSEAIDACAAPGNKTSHLASHMRNQGRVFAFDLDPRRLDTLKSLTHKAGCAIIVPQCQSFLDVEPGDPRYANVEYVLLDPSCSGSGIVNRLDGLVDAFIQGEEIRQHRGKPVPGAATNRLDNLAEFQYS